MAAFCSTSEAIQLYVLEKPGALWLESWAAVAREKYIRDDEVTVYIYWYMYCVTYSLTGWLYDVSNLQ